MKEAARSLWLGVGSSLDPPKDWAGCQEDIERESLLRSASHGVCEKPGCLSASPCGASPSCLSFC